MLLERSKRWSREEYEKLADVLPEDVRVELLEGVIVEMSPQNPAHSYVVAELTRLLLPQLAEDLTLRVQLPLALSDRSEPEPDIAVVRRDPSHRMNHPSQALLIVEVAESSLEYDRSLKKELYREAGVPEYWIVNLKEHCIEVSQCRQERTFREDETLRSQHLEISLTVGDLFR